MRHTGIKQLDGVAIETHAALRIYKRNNHYGKKAKIRVAYRANGKTPNKEAAEIRRQPVRDPAKGEEGGGRRAAGGSLREHALTAEPSGCSQQRHGSLESQLLHVAKETGVGRERSPQRG